MDLKEIERECVDWIRTSSGYGSLANFCEHGNEHSEGIGRVAVSSVLNALTLPQNAAIPAEKAFIRNAY
jgi:hypothetical protein